MRLSMAAFLLLAFSGSMACKNKSFRGNSEKKSNNTSSQTKDDDDDGDARPTIAESEFVIKEATQNVLEGVLQRRSDGGIDVGGGVAGVWDKSVSPVHVQNDLTLGGDKTLSIKAGVTVIMENKSRISVEGGQLKIEGTASEKVVFKPENPSEGWAGIKLCPDAECRQVEGKGRLEVRYAVFEGSRKENNDPNDASWRRGGVFYIRETISALIEDSAFNDNSALERGGAIEIIADNRNVVLRRNSFTGNHNDGGSGGGGGALHITHGRNLTVEDNVFTNNYSKGDGGAVYLLDSAGIVLKNNTFKGNSAASNGGAIRCDGHASLITIDASNKMQDNKPNDLSCDP